MTPTNWGLYDARVSLHGDTTRERTINNFKTNMTRYGVDSGSCKDIKIDNVPQKLFILDTKDPYVKDCQDIFDVLYGAGTIIEYATSHWLVEKLSFDGEIFKTGILRQCNYNLRFLPLSLQPVSRYCCVSSSTSSTDNTGGSVNFEYGIGNFSIKLPFDAETSLLDRTYADTGKNQRILMDFASLTPLAYEIKSANRVENSGIITLMVGECGRSADDNVELMIADYFSRYETAETVPTSASCQIIFNGAANIQIGKAAKKFTAKFLDENGDVLTGEIPVWTLTMANPALLDKVTNVMADDYITIKISDISLIGETIRLDLTDSTASVSNYIMLGVESIG